MNSIRLVLLFAAVCLPLSACDTAVDHHAVMHGPEAGQRTDADETRNVPGYQLSLQYCSQCHAMPDPQSHAADEWPSVVGRMIDNMRRLGKAVPDPQQTGEILEYLQRHARKT